MNLYIVSPYHKDWCCFVFARSRNRAKSLVAGYLRGDYEIEYIDLRSRTGAKNTEVKDEAVVDWDEHPLYETVKKYGYEYLNWDEIEEV